MDDPLKKTTEEVLDIVKKLDPDKDYHMTFERKGNVLEMTIVERPGGNLPGRPKPVTVTREQQDPSLAGVSAMPNRLLPFCPRCFASSEDSSWGAPAMEGHCFNCGGGGTITIPAWAIKSIRGQASWVGKRYYPHEEDKERSEEIKALRALAPDDPERTASSRPQGFYMVGQPSQDGGTTSVGPVYADSPEEALKKAKTHLPYRYWRDR